MRLRAHSASFRPHDTRRHCSDLFLVSALTLFLARVSLRWFPEQVVQLGRVPNVVLLACLLGSAIGCLAVGRAPRLIVWTPLCLALTLILATDKVVEWTNRCNLPIDEIVPGLFFVLIALTLAGPGQELGRVLNKIPNRLFAFTLIVLGSAAGLVLFAGCTYAELGPCWWFLAVVLGLAYFAGRHGFTGVLFLSGIQLANLLILAGTLGLIAWTSWSLSHLGEPFETTFWSPYARIYYGPRISLISPLLGPTLGWETSDLPYLLNRDAGGPPFRRVLVIGAKEGDDVSEALRWGANHVDAVEIDPVILRLGRDEHPDHPYQNPRVHIHLGDGRRFLRSCNQEYDLILYTAMQIPPPEVHDHRRVKYLLTRQAFADARRCLSPHGMFVLVGRLQWGWVAARLRLGLEEVFPESPLLMPIPSQRAIAPGNMNGLVLFFAGHVGHLRQAFQENTYSYPGSNLSSSPEMANRFTQPIRTGRREESFGLATVDETEYLDTPEDDWPFLFLRRRMIPDQVSRDLILLAILSIVLLWTFRPTSPFPPLHKAPPMSLIQRVDAWPLFRLEMFCLGAGFMLTAITTRIDATLLFGDTWIIDTAAVLAVLALLLVALGGIWVLDPPRLWPLYTALLVTLVLHRLFPLDHVLRHGLGLRAAVSYLIGLAPVLFAGMIFALPFQRSAEPARDCGAVLAGAVLGAMMGTLALAWGFHSLILAALGSFAVAAVPSARWALLEYDRRYPPADPPLRNGARLQQLPDYGKR